MDSSIINFSRKNFQTTIELEKCLNCGEFNEKFYAPTNKIYFILKEDFYVYIEKKVKNFTDDDIILYKTLCALLNCFINLGRIKIIEEIKEEKREKNKEKSENSAINFNILSKEEKKEVSDNIKEVIELQIDDKEIEHSKIRKKLKFVYNEIIGESPKLISILEQIDKIAKTDLPVLIEGESGTGKELIAKAIHQNSLRAKLPFVSENCAAIPETLLESELFGYKKGAFTGAYSDKKGLLEIANKGTLFLDEIGEMSLNMQKKLLRVLQSGEIRAVGDKVIKKVDVRIIAATNKNLLEEVKKKTFREDLYYRLNVVKLVLPPLRERGKDIIILFNYFIKKIAKEMGIKSLKVEKEVYDLLLNYKWPGNIREMENLVKRILALLEDDTIRVKDIIFFGIS